MTDAPDIKARRRLDKLGLMIESARRAEAQAMKELAEAATEALDVGIRKAEIAERTGISRPTLDRILSQK